MRYDDVIDELQAPTSLEFSSVIVYLKRWQKADGSYTSELGKFHLIPMHDTFWGTRQDDWSLEGDMYFNRNGQLIKPVHITFDKHWFFKSTLFCRIKTYTPDERVDEMLGQLNAHIDLFKDELREDIAQEWCAQEPWRRYPYKPGPYNDPKVSIYGMLYDANPILDGLAEVMGYLLPKGYDEDTPATHLI